MERRKAIDAFLGGEGFEYRDGMHYFHGRHVITHETPILNGVSIGEAEREAIHVDPNGKELLRLYKQVRERIVDPKTNAVQYNRVLPAVFATTHQSLHFDSAAVDALVARKKAKADGIVVLDDFIKAGAGECRHQALLSAALIELLQKDKLLSGTVRVHRNKIPHVGGHMFPIYTWPNGIKEVIDVAQNYMGPLKGGLWTYEQEKEKG